MPKFSTSSKRKLEQADLRLQIICKKAIELYDFTIITSYRSEEEQNQHYNAGTSKVRYPESKHNSMPAKAVDIAPYPIDWQDTKRFFYLAGIMKTIAALNGIPLRWGGDWDSDKDFNDQTFNDLVHFEIID